MADPILLLECPALVKWGGIDYRGSVNLLQCQAPYLTMKITIDTQHDTFEDIQKVLHILTGILQPQKGNQITPPPQNIDTSSMMNMFSETPPAAPADKAPDFSSFLNLTKKTEEKSQIEFY